MEIAGLAIAIFNEAFEIGTFITQTVIDAAHQDKDFRKLESEFTYHQTILATFGRRFIESKFIYSLETCWATQIKRILEELRKVVGEYARLAAKYEESYRTMMGNLEEWWKVSASEQQLGENVDRRNLLLEAIDISKSTKPPKPPLGLRDRISRKFTKLEWALFDRKKLEEVVKDQKEWTAKLVEVMKLTLLPLPRFSDNVSQLQELCNDAKTLGFSKLTNTRLLILDPTQGSQATEINVESISKLTIPLWSDEKALKQLHSANLNGSVVLVEFKTYETQDRRVWAFREIRLLSRLLGVEEDNDHTCYTLRCLGYFQEQEFFGLVFNIPQGYDTATPPFSLYLSISTLTKDTQPTLGQRFGIAYAMGYTLLEWFLVGWVHKSISSHKVFFLQKANEKGTSEQGWDFSSPYLFGFEYARPEADPSNGGHDRVDFDTDIYRHPHRHGPPTKPFKKRYDVYAFGVMLLEIGTWMTAREFFSGEIESGSAIRNILVKNARDRLGHSMGEKYRDAVLFCLEPPVIQNDDAKESKLIAAFNEKVVDVCKAGKQIL